MSIFYFLGNMANVSLNSSFVFCIIYPHRLCDLNIMLHGLHAPGGCTAMTVKVVSVNIDSTHVILINNDCSGLLNKYYTKRSTSKIFHGVCMVMLQSNK